MVGHRIPVEVDYEIAADRAVARGDRRLRVAFAVEFETVNVLETAVTGLFLRQVAAAFQRQCIRLIRESLVFQREYRLGRIVVEFDRLMVSRARTV